MMAFSKQSYKLRHFILLAWLCFMAMINAFSQTRNKSFSNLFNEYSLIRNIADLPDSDLKGIIKDDLGFLWMHTRHHLVRFDGNSFLVVETQPRSQFRLNGNNLIRIGKDLDGKIVVQYDEDNLLFDLIDQITLEVEPYYKDEIENFVDARIGSDFHPLEMHFREDSIIIVKLHNQTKSVVCKFLNPVFEYPSEVKIIYADSSDIVLVENSHAIVRISDCRSSIYRWPTTFNDGGIKFFHKAKNGQFLFSFNDYPGVFKLANHEPIPILDSIFPADELYGGIWEDYAGNIMVSIKENFRNIKSHLIIDRYGNKFLERSLVDQNIDVNGLFAESIFEKTYLTTSRGLYLGEQKNTRFQYYLDEDIAENQFGTVLAGIAQIDSNTIVASHEFDSISIISTNAAFKSKSINITLTNPEDSSTFQMSCASNLVFDGVSSVWGSSCDANKNAYLYQYDFVRDTTLTYLCFKNCLISDFTFNRQKDLIWITMRYQGKDGILGAFSLNDTSFTIKKGPIDPIFQGNIPNAVFSDDDQKLLLSTDKGMVVYKVGTEELALQYEELRDQKLNYVTKSVNGDYLIGGYNGLFIADGEGTIQNISREQGIKSKVVSILEDPYENLWMGTSNGLLYYDRHLGIITNYNQQDGLKSAEFREGSSLVTPSNYYFGTINGMMSISKIEENDQDDLEPQILQVRKLHMTKGSITQRSNLNKMKKLTITPSDLMVSVSIFNPYFLSQKKESFAYKIEGSDIAWNPIALNEDIQLEKLPPGDFNLRVRMKKSNGLWSANELSLPINVREEFYKSGGFIIISSIIMIGIFGLIMHYFNVRSRVKQQEENEIKQKFAELELHALRAQMNPHFIFNSLNAIQYFIQSNDRIQSDQYISKFAHLIRLFLDASTKKYISLDEEIKVISSYIDLEQLRFRGKLDSKIIIDDTLNTMDTIIPSMLIQPFVENAINHGIFHKKNKGTVTIHLKEVGEDLIQCIVEDDGIGREKARQIKMNSIGKYESRGISIIDDRIQVLQRSLNQEIDYQIVDKVENGTASGTKVILKLPVIE